MLSWCAATAVIAGLCAPAMAQSVAQRLPVCVACHGSSGTSMLEGVPSLGAQMNNYVLAQLLVFREKQRVAAPMNAMTAGLSDDDLQELSAAIAKLPPPEPAKPSLDTAELEQAQALISHYRCNSCHGAELAGGGQVPRVAGQREGYLRTSLEQYKSNARPGYNPAMNEAAQDIRSEDIPILAKFLAQSR